MWGVGGMEMMRHYVTLNSSAGGYVKSKKTVLIKRKVVGPEVFQVNLHCYTTILDGIKNIPFLWQSYAIRHTSARAQGEVFDVYFWKKGIYYSWGDGMLVYFFAVLSEFSEFYSNQAKEDDSLLI